MARRPRSRAVTSCHRRALRYLERRERYLCDSCGKVFDQVVVERHNPGVADAADDAPTADEALPYEHMFAVWLGGPMPRTSRTIVCVHRSPLRPADRDAEAPPGDRPAALAPEAGGRPLIGEVNAAAATFGVRPGMRAGEAIARCPRIELVAADPGAVADAAEAMLVDWRGSAPRSSRWNPGRALLRADGLVRMHGGMGRLLRRGRGMPAGGRPGGRRPRALHRPGGRDAGSAGPAADGRTPTPRRLRRPDGNRPAGPRRPAERTSWRRSASARRASWRRCRCRRWPTASAGGIAGWRLARGEDEAYVAPRMPPEPMRRVDRSSPSRSVTRRPCARRVVLLLERLLASRGERAGRCARWRCRRGCRRAARGDGRLRCATPPPSLAVCATPCSPTCSSCPARSTGSPWSWSSWARRAAASRCCFARLRRCAASAPPRPPTSCAQRWAKATCCASSRSRPGHGCRRAAPAGALRGLKPRPFASAAARARSTDNHRSLEAPWLAS